MKPSVICSALVLFLSASLLADEAEIKFVVQSKNNEAAWEKLAPLKKIKPKKQIVCFFETAEPSLGGSPANLILRVRQPSGEPGDSTVKVRADSKAKPASKIEKNIPAEQDWTNPTTPNFSRSLDQESLSDEVTSPVMKGKASPQSLFNPAQTKLIFERKNDFTWDSLRRYGPLTSYVWKKDFHLSQDFPKVAVEQWLLENGKRKREMLELSIKLKDVKPAEIKATAARFFSAVEAAGFGKPEFTSKTKQALEFYQPGR